MICYSNRLALLALYTLRVQAWPVSQTPLAIEEVDTTANVPKPGNANSAFDRRSYSGAEDWGLWINSLHGTEFSYFQGLNITGYNMMAMCGDEYSSAEFIKVEGYDWWKQRMRNYTLAAFSADRIRERPRSMCDTTGYDKTGAPKLRACISWSEYPMYNVSETVIDFIIYRGEYCNGPKRNMSSIVYIKPQGENAMAFCNSRREDYCRDGGWFKDFTYYNEQVYPDEANSVPNKDNGPSVEDVRLTRHG